VHSVEDRRLHPHHFCEGEDDNGGGYLFSSKGYGPEEKMGSGLVGERKVGYQGKREKARGERPRRGFCLKKEKRCY
jgi:hypothetical protein